ncbi:putative DNA binding domain-containing protein [Gordonia alkanivorans]|uniref:RNA-binding domain-containing protein n=1 Tax=Gordonia alkanivorans TaxID=84096 RepID=UPI00244C1CD8|nr:RNA-binding domain-containing protein [Gordonia alkanivorans]MDH3051246.1 putative DNA binding domain-containing protein [Gordonia alkanivorans]
MSGIDTALYKVRSGTFADSVESSTLDFKTEKQGGFKETAVDLAEACVCFANSTGGIVVLGIKDKPGGADAFVGTSINADKLRSAIYDRTEPHLTVSIEEVHYEGSRLLQITVPEGLEVYSTSQGEYCQRWMSECRPMDPGAVARLSDERRGNDWSAESSGTPIDAVDTTAIEKVRELLRLTDDDARVHLSRSSPAEIVRRLGLAADDGCLTRAGEILLVEKSSSGPQELLVYQHRRTPSGEADFSRRWGTPLVTTFAEVLEVISARLSVTPITVRSGQQLAIEDFSSIAIREALANALIHRDLRENQPVQVRHSPATLNINSPGPLVAGVTPDNILTRGTKPRYPSLAKAFNTLGWGEYLGQGVNRMFREMARSGRPLPEIQSYPDRVEVLFRGAPPNIHVARLVAELPEDLKNDTDTLLILMRLCAKKSVTAQQIAPIIQRSVEDAESALRHASQSEVELVEPTAGTRNRKYPNYRFRGDVLARLGPAVAYHSRTSGEVDRKIIDHVREYNSINNATVQRLFDIDVYGARDILKNLVGREVLTRVSTQTRGKAVKYGPGPRFPAKKTRRKQTSKGESLTLFSDGSE